MRWKSLFSFDLVFPLLTFCIGTAFGVVFRDFPFLSLKKDVSIGEISNLLLAVIFAVYIPFYLNKKIDNRRIEKDLHISECSNLEQELKKFKESVFSTYILRKKISVARADEIIIRGRDMSNQLNLLLESVGNFSKDVRIEELSGYLIRNQYDYVGAISQNLRGSARVINSSQYLKAEQAYVEYCGNIARMKFYLNEC